MVGIPTLPISWTDALPVLESLRGSVAPVPWRGALPVTYRIGPGPAAVRLRVSFDWNLVPIHNVIARLDGRERPDEWVMRGNHHDAWVHGAEDPIAGLVAMLAEARAIGKLAAKGWRPRRSIVYAAWDGEEPGLFGSVEWVEHHADELREKLVAYINTDYNRRGVLQAFGSPSLQALFTEVTQGVDDPLRKVSVYRRKIAAELLAGAHEEQDETSRDFALMPLGSGSDFSGFVQHLGVASLDFSFVGDTAGGSYHTGYDTHDHFTRFMDPGFLYTRTLAQISGRLTLRLADADVLPFRMTAVRQDIGTYMDEVVTLLAERKQVAERHNRLLAAEVFRIAPTQGEYAAAPAPLAVPPDLDFAALMLADERLADAAACFDAAIARTAGNPPGPDTVASVNRLIREAERRFLRPEGLPGRPWFRHYISAPGSATGYEAKTFPSVREAIESGDWAAAQQEIGRLARVLTAFAGHVGKGCSLLQPDAEATPHDE
jgi:N-acetylated-alpha-linked acidic dipeptidase